MAKQNNKLVSNTVKDFIALDGKCVELNLSEADITWTGKLCNNLVLQLEKSKSLRTVNFRNTGMSSDVLNMLVKGLKACKRLQALDLSNNNIADNGAGAIADLIKSTKSKQINSISLHFNDIGDEGSEVLSKAILGYSKNIAPTTMKITLNNNNISEEGVKAIEKLIGDVFNIIATPQNELESKSSDLKSPFKTGSLVCSPKKINPSKEEARLKAAAEEKLKADKSAEVEAQLKADKAAAEEKLKVDKTLTLQKEIMSMVSNRGEPDSTDKKIFRDKLTKHLQNGNLLKDDFFRNCIKTLCEKTGFWNFMVKTSETTKALAKGLSHNDECLKYLGIRNGNDRTIVENITDTLNNYRLLNYDLELDDYIVTTVLSGEIGE